MNNLDSIENRLEEINNDLCELSGTETEFLMDLVWTGVMKSVQSAMKIIDLYRSAVERR